MTYHWNNLDTYFWNSNLTPPDLSWCMIALTVNSTSAKIYLGTISGVTSATNIRAHVPTTLANLELGRDSFGGRLFTGGIAIAQLYNRALSDTEILQNFNSTKSRFGI